MFRRLREGLRRGERGVIIIWMALFILVMFMFVALGIDGAKLMATRGQLQNAADAGALAGATAIDPATGAMLIDEAKARAAATAAANRAYQFVPTPVQVADEDIVVDTTARTVTVTARRWDDQGMVTQFSKLVGIPKLNVKATAVAQVNRPTTVCTKLRPFGVDTLNVNQFVPGQEYVLSEGLAPGNYEFLNFPTCGEGPCSGFGSGGADEVRCLIENGYGCCIDIGQDVPVKTGTIAGAVRAGVDYLFDHDVVSAEYPSSQLNSYAAYQAAGGSDLRVVIVPLVTWHLLSGSNSYAHVNSFASFFLKRRYGNGSNNYFTGEFIDHVIPVGKGNGNGGTVYIVHLIR
jgi:Flp pilus assembly protein TadG